MQVWSSLSFKLVISSIPLFVKGFHQRSLINPRTSVISHPHCQRYLASMTKSSSSYFENKTTKIIQLPKPAAKQSKKKVGSSNDSTGMKIIKSEKRKRRNSTEISQEPLVKVIKKTKWKTKVPIKVNATTTEVMLHSLAPLYPATVVNRPSKTIKSPYLADIKLEGSEDIYMCHTPSLGCMG